MSQSRNGPRKPATKFPHLRKQMQQNALHKTHATKLKNHGSKHSGRKPS